jgi:hypothetical protein
MSGALFPQEKSMTTDRIVHIVADRLRNEPNVQDVYERSFVGNGRVIAMLKDGRTEKSDDFQRRLAPDLL